MDEQISNTYVTGSGFVNGLFQLLTIKDCAFVLTQVLVALDLERWHILHFTLLITIVAGGYYLPHTDRKLYIPFHIMYHWM